MLTGNFVIIPNTTKGNFNHDPRTGQFSSGGAPVSFRDAGSIHGVTSERNTSRVLQFSKGGGSVLDKSVRMVTNTDRNGQLANGTLRVEISDATKRSIYERPMAQLPTLLAQLAAKGYELHAQHYRSPKNLVKAEGKWVTLPTGARIQIHGGGGAQEKTQDKSQANEAKPAQENESQRDSGAELTHEQRTQIVNKLAAKMGIPKDKIEMREQDEPADEQGKLMAQYDPATDKISVFPEGFAHGKQELIGTLAHEIMHQKFKTVVFELKRQKKLFDAGEDRRKLQIYNEIAPVFQEDNRSLYEHADGQTRYSTLFWDSYKQDRTQPKYARAVNETLAEVEYLRAIGQDKDIHPLFGNLARRIRGFAESL